MIAPLVLAAQYLSLGRDFAPPGIWIGKKIDTRGAQFVKSFFFPHQTTKLPLFCQEKFYAS
jgi:hypothetical protein